MRKYPVGGSRTSGYVDPNPNTRNEVDGKRDGLEEENVVNERVGSMRALRDGPPVTRARELPPSWTSISPPCFANGRLTQL